MKYRQLVDDQRVRFVDDTSSRVFSSCARLIALTPNGETGEPHEVAVARKSILAKVKKRRRVP